MRSRTLALTGILIVALLVGAGAVYAYDHGNDGQIAEGVTVNGVDVGGMTADEARAALRSRAAGPAQPARWSPATRASASRSRREQASIGVDIDGSVHRALAASREGSMFTRTWREVRGEELDERPGRQDHVVAPGRAQARARACSGRSTAPPSTPSWTSRAAASTPQPSKDGLAVARQAPAARPRARAARLRRQPPREGPHRDRASRRSPPRSWPRSIRPC